MTGINQRGGNDFEITIPQKYEAAVRFFNAPEKRPHGRRFRHARRTRARNRNKLRVIGPQTAFRAPGNAPVLREHCGSSADPSRPLQGRARAGEQAACVGADT